MELVGISDFAVSSELLIKAMVFDAPKCLVHTNFFDLNEDFAHHHLETLYIARQQILPDVRLHRLPAHVNLAVRNDEDFIAYLGDSVVTEQVRPYWATEDIVSAVGSTIGSEEVAHEALLLARFGFRTWGHWLAELLPKAVCTEHLYPGRFRYVVPTTVATDPTLNTIAQSLDAYGIGRERLLFVRGGRSYRFAHLFAVSPVWFPHCAMHPRVVELMRVILHNRRPCFSRPKNIALLRRESATRNLLNIDQISAYLESSGWLITDIGAIDFLEQVKIFANSENVVSVLGSGLTGLIYAPEGVRVVTLAPSNWGDLFFFSLMQERRTRLADIRGVSQGEDPAQAALLAFLIKIEDLETGLRALGLSAQITPTLGAHAV
jgi:hypothetical protein